MLRLPAARLPALLLSALLLSGAGLGPAAFAQEPSSPVATAERLVEEAREHGDLGERQQAVAKYREALALRPAGGTYRELGDLLAEMDRHPEAIEAYRAAVSADRSLEPELRMPIGVQLLWADRPKEAIPLLASVVENRPHDPEPKRYLALALRWSDRLREAEDLYRQILMADPGDAEARIGLAESLLWQGRFRSATGEYLRVLEDRPADPESLTGLSRARLFLDLPEEAEEVLSRVPPASRSAPEVRDQAARIRERLARTAEFGYRISHDSDDLTIHDLSISLRARPARGLDLEGSARQLFFRQGAPGKEDNLDAEDSVAGTSGALSIRRRPSPRWEWRAAAALSRYDAVDFSPWGGALGASVDPCDTVRVDLDWERSHWDSILSLQNRVVIDTAGLAVTKQIAWKTEISATAALLRHRNENDSGQERDNRGSQFGLTLTRRLYLRGDDAYLAGILRLGWLGFDRDLDVGVFDPERYTSQEAGVDWRVRLRPDWEFHGTAMAGSQQEKGADSGPTYSVEAALDRRIGLGSASIGGFASDSNSGGQGEGFRRYGGLLRCRIPF